jgi:hypothetical protein
MSNSSSKKTPSDVTNWRRRRQKEGEEKKVQENARK